MHYKYNHHDVKIQRALAIRTSTKSQIMKWTDVICPNWKWY